MASRNIKRGVSAVGWVPQDGGGGTEPRQEQGDGSGGSLGKTAKISALIGFSTGSEDHSVTWPAGAATEIPQRGVQLGMLHRPAVTLLSLVPAETVHVRYQQGTGRQRCPLQPQNSHPNQSCRHPA